MSATEPIRNKQHVREMSMYYLKRGKMRNHLLIVLSIHTALRVSDLLRLRWDDVWDFEVDRPRDSVWLYEQKTRKSKRVALNERIRRALTLCAPSLECSGKVLIENPRTRRAISRIQAYRIIRAAAENLGIGRVSCHSLRKTFGYHAWKSGVSPTVIMEIYNHSSYAVTRRYLGVAQDDTNAAYHTIAKRI